MYSLHCYFVYFVPKNDKCSRTTFGDAASSQAPSDSFE